MIKEKVDTHTYLSHDHDLVARKIKLFNSLPEDNFGMPITSNLVIQGQEYKLNKRADLTRIGRIKRIDSCIITCHGNHRQNRIIAISWILIILTLP